MELLFLLNRELLLPHIFPPPPTPLARVCSARCLISQSDLNKNPVSPIIVLRCSSFPSITMPPPVLPSAVWVTPGRSLGRSESLGPSALIIVGLVFLITKSPNNFETFFVHPSSFPSASYEWNLPNFSLPQYSFLPGIFSIVFFCPITGEASGFHYPVLESSIWFDVYFAVCTLSLVFPTFLLVCGKIFPDSLA